MSYSVKDLTPGERLWVDRRHRNESVFQGAKRHKVSEYAYHLWEADTPTDESPIPWVPLKSMDLADAVAIARRRKGFTIKALMMITRLSHVTIIKWERNGTPGLNPLVKFWDVYGWP